MSLLPAYLFGDNLLWPRPSRLFNQDFGLALSPNDLLSPILRDSGELYHPLQQLSRAAQDLGTSIKSDKDKFQINVDVQHFSPEEISVKTADGQLIIEGKHEERKDEHGFVSRKFVRRYALPEDCQLENVQSKLSSDGVLTVTAPKQHFAVKGERVVPIQHTGPVRKELKDHSEEAK